MRAGSLAFGREPSYGLIRRTERGVDIVGGCMKGPEESAQFTVVHIKSACTLNSGPKMPLLLPFQERTTNLFFLSFEIQFM